MEQSTASKLITFVVIILAASTAAMIYLSNISSVSFNEHLYEAGYAKYNIRDRFDPSINLTNETRFLIDYLSSGSGEIQTPFFNAREKTHLVEVRDLFKLTSKLFHIFTIISTISAILLAFLVARCAFGLSEQENRELYKKTIARFLVLTGAIVDIAAIFFAFVAVTFSTSFIRFHEIFFKTDTWMLDPATDNLIRMYPEGFFFDMLLKIVFYSIIFATILLVMGFIIKLGKPKLHPKQLRK